MFQVKTAKTMADEKIDKILEYLKSLEESQEEGQYAIKRPINQIEKNVVVAKRTSCSAL